MPKLTVKIRHSPLVFTHEIEKSRLALTASKMMLCEPGKRESRYAHIFSGTPESTMLSATKNAENEASDREIIEALEKQVLELQMSLDELRQKYEL
jgi:uncharacterized protein YceH (UPF0502 family)